jgi:hypothetical protein
MLVVVAALVTAGATLKVEERCSTTNTPASGEFFPGGNQSHSRSTFGALERGSVVSAAGGSQLMKRIEAAEARKLG